MASHAPNNPDIFISGRDGSHARTLLPHPAADCDASFSPDRRWAVFTSHRTGQADIYRVQPDGSGLERLADDPAFDDQGVLSADRKSELPWFGLLSTRNEHIGGDAHETQRLHQSYVSFCSRREYVRFRFSHGESIRR